MLPVAAIREVVSQVSLAAYGADPPTRPIVSYDSLSRLSGQTDPLGRTTHFSYDPVNRPTGTVDPLGGTAVLGYKVGQEKFVTVSQ